jgi:hypothetical protein
MMNEAAEDKPWLLYRSVYKEMMIKMRVVYKENATVPWWPDLETSGARDRYRVCEALGGFC